MKRRHFLFYLAAVLMSCYVGWGLGIFQRQSAIASTNLLVSAAASLKDVMEEIKPLYQAQQPRVTLSFNFGASGALLQQIQQGAPVDVFISAAQQQMDTLDKSKAILSGTRRNLARNRLVLIVPQASPSVSSFLSLKEAGVKRVAIGEPRSVPAGQYAEQVLQHLGLLPAIKSKLVYANNVRQVLATVASGNADAGLVYRTDAQLSKKVKVVAVADQASHSPIVYPMAVLKRSKNPEAAKAFVQYLSSSPAQAVLRKYGFMVTK